MSGAIYGTPIRDANLALPPNPPSSPSPTPLSPSPSASAKNMTPRSNKRQITAKIHSGPPPRPKKKKKHNPPNVPSITAHTVDENQSAAEYFKSILQASPETHHSLGPLTRQPEEGSEVVKYIPIEQETQEAEKGVALPSPEWMAARMIRHAYEQEYNGRPGARRGVMETGWRDQTELWERSNNHILGQQGEDDVAPEYVYQASPEINVEIAKENLAETQAWDSHSQFGMVETPTQGVILPGMGNGITRNDHGHSVQGGQAVGTGVIGNYQSNPTSNNQLQTVQTEVGCDIPMRQFHTVKLDAKLPPLAMEHPARVWNSTIHALPTDKQPTVKWDYERQRDDFGGETGYLWLLMIDMAYLAHLTLILPPSHPSIANHALFHALPKNRYSREYIEAMVALGGVKRWTGDLNLLKVGVFLDILLTTGRCAKYRFGQMYERRRD